ncbi:MAG: hypothetical protein HFI89_00950 [Lachnospiraceae bacterium]|nr:hypothetical protein [Lachnospiraceae bacterium]
MKRTWKKFGNRVPEKLAGKWKRKRQEDDRPDGQESGMLPGEGNEDDGYDGYYDDVLPEDYGSPAEGLDKELLKRVALVMGGMLFAAVACAAIMYLL